MKCRIIAGAVFVEDREDISGDLVYVVFVLESLLTKVNCRV